MLSKSLIKFIRSLRLSKFRALEEVFVIEGDKLVREALDPLTNSNFKIHSIYALQSWIDENQKIIHPYKEITSSVTTHELGLISNLKTPNQALALVHANSPEINIKLIEEKLLIALDNVQDPGNMGTIIRLADWFGINNIILSPGCADPLNPKVIQATMGSIFRVSLYRKEIEPLIDSLPKEYPVYGAVLNGESIYNTKLSSQGIILMGNESRGISKRMEKSITHALTIPRADQTGPGPESLNVAVSLGIILSEFSRQIS